jgi:hypothetical protein
MSVYVVDVISSHSCPYIPIQLCIYSGKKKWYKYNKEVKYMGLPLKVD